MTTIHQSWGRDQLPRTYGHNVTPAEPLGAPPPALQTCAASPAGVPSLPAPPLEPVLPPAVQLQPPGLLLDPLVPTRSPLPWTPASPWDTVAGLEVQGFAESVPIESTVVL